MAASAPSIYAYAVGNAIYVLGVTGLFLLQVSFGLSLFFVVELISRLPQNIIISDISSTRNRLFWSIFPSIPGVSTHWRSAAHRHPGPRSTVGPDADLLLPHQVINVWVSGNITQSLLGAKQETANNWRWGLGQQNLSAGSPTPNAHS